jgi:hypothetical protein
MILLVYEVFNIKANIHIKEKTISAMKAEIVNEIDADF